MSVFSAAPSPKRWVFLVILIGIVASVVGMGWNRLLSLEAVGQHFAHLKAFIHSDFWSAICLYILAYVAVVAISLPGAFLLTTAGGLMFGWKIGAVAALFAATVGATVLFVLARASLGDAARSAPWLQRLSAGFRGNALNYLLFLRLVPLFPFVAVNWAPALFGMPLSTYVVGTFFGMIPVTVAYAVTGSGLGGVLEAQNAVYAACLDQQLREPNLACLYTLDTGQLITCELTAGLLVMGLLALLPVAMKRWSARNAVRRRDGKIRGFVADDAP